MKSKISKVVIIPSGLLCDRKLKYLIRGAGWIDSLDFQMRELSARMFCRIEAVINPDDVFQGEVGYAEGDFYGTAKIPSFITLNELPNLIPLILHEKRFG
jgi:hypothetical protein